MAKQTTHHRRIAAGLCYACGGQPQEGKKLCRPCADKQTERVRAFQQRCKEKGLCPCGNKPIPGMKKCANCRESLRRASKRAYDKRKHKPGACTCGRPSAPGIRRCEGCRKASKKVSKRVFQERKAAGVCRACGAEPLPGGAMCAEHRGYYARWARRFHHKLRREVIAAYGGRCTCCGETNLEFLTLDHVNNDGAEHRRSGIHSGTDILRWAKKNGYPSMLDIKCWNCNLARAHYGICPHERARREAAAKEKADGG